MSQPQVSTPQGRNKEEGEHKDSEDLEGGRRGGSTSEQTGNWREFWGLQWDLMRLKMTEAEEKDFPRANLLNIHLWTAYRFLMASFFLGIFLWSILQEFLATKNGPWWFIYLTNWTVLVFLAYLWLAFTTSLALGIISPIEEHHLSPQQGREEAKHDVDSLPKSGRNEKNSSRTNSVNVSARDHSSKLRYPSKLIMATWIFQNLSMRYESKRFLPLVVVAMSSTYL